ncbi:glutaredoxin-like protein [Candidatus Methanoperedens nitroreducens]|uniref:Glutaredoxin-like protein n=1 Tax=Candidatus Methanoperedens nitratireducens TaxID=1392998 RepID=A0A062VCQ1_9EURY|nr:thioredoxin family protein [Candidatus Methanoperedens nitroreducens]KCZ73030.1 glutaredoxin-like protein [Candidatus Methanoperedens nitroreducens]MDJ1423026.1 thioredoxin family protein [Candidatus Methanoperedens sp.]
MVTVQILTTPSCTSCAIVERMLDKMGIKYELIDITKNPEVLQKYPIMAAPGVVINGKLEFVGVPKEQELAKKVRT